MDDKMGTGSEQGNAPNNNNVLEVTVDNKKQTYDLSKPESRETLKKLVEKGSKMDSVWSEKSELQKQVESMNKKVVEYDNFVNTFEMAKTDTQTYDKLIDFIEDQLGRPLTKSEETGIADDVMSGEKNEFSKLYDRMSTMEKQINDKFAEQENKRASERLMSSLGQVIRDKEKYPHAQENEMIAFAKQNNMSDWSMVYKILYWDKHTAKESQKDFATLELEKRRSMASTLYGGLGGRGNRTEKPRSYKEAALMGLADLQNRGKL